MAGLSGAPWGHHSLELWSGYTKRPLSPVRRIVDLGRKIYSRRGETVASGREMPFHFRRGTFRTFRHERYNAARGRTIPIPSTLVRLDKHEGDLPTRPVYRVEPD